MTYALTPSEDLRQIIDAAQSMLDTHYPLARLRDPSHVDAMGPLAEFGAFALALPEDLGGAGFTLLEEAYLHVKLGAHLVSPSALGASIGARLGMTAVNVPGDADLHGGIVTGDIRLCMGVSTADTWMLFDPDGAEQAVIQSGEGYHLAPINPADLTPVTAMGHGRPMAQMPAQSMPNTPTTDVASTAALLVAAQLLGVGTAARDLAVQYAMIREQFGHPIGSFQAVKHHCANMTIAVEMVAAQLDMAAIALRDGRTDAGFQIAALSRLAPKAALNNARTGIQVHGGIGFSAEADAHLFLKQAHMLAQLLPSDDMLTHAAPMAPTRPKQKE